MSTPVTSLTPSSSDPYTCPCLLCSNHSSLLALSRTFQTTSRAGPCRSLCPECFLLRYERASFLIDSNAAPPTLHKRTLQFSHPAYQLPFSNTAFYIHLLIYFLPGSPLAHKLEEGRTFLPSCASLYLSTQTSLDSHSWVIYGVA